MKKIILLSILYSLLQQSAIATVILKTTQEELQEENDYYNMDYSPRFKEGRIPSSFDPYYNDEQIENKEQKPQYWRYQDE